MDKQVATNGYKKNMGNNRSMHVLVQVFLRPTYKMTNNNVLLYRLVLNDL